MKHLSIIICCLLFSTVFGQNTPQDRAENAVIKHVEKTFPKKEYHGYEFGDLYKITPPEITEIEELKNEAKLIDISNDRLVNYYDSLIQQKIKEVKANKIFPTYEINHFFTLKEKYKQPILYEYKFELFPDGKIKDVNKKLEFTLTDGEYDYYYYYYKRKDLYSDPNKNKELYKYLELLYNNEKLSKEAAMSTLLTVSKVVYEYNVYDTTLIAKIEAQKWLNRHLKGSFLIKKYSEVNAIIDTATNTVLGYNLFTKISQNDSLKAFYFEFDYDYIIRGVLPVEFPFDQYFKTQSKAIKKD